MAKHQMALELRPVATIEIPVRPPVDLGNGRRYVILNGGTFTGRDGLAGKVLEGGVDWQLIRPDGVIEIDAHYALMTDADELIEVRSNGIRKLPRSVARRLERGEPVAPEEYYFRTHVRLSTGAPRLAWMNDLIALSTGERYLDLVRLDIHEVL